MAIEHKPANGGERLEAAIAELDTKQVKVGYFPTSRYPDGKPVAGVAVVQEFGSVARRIPPRPFFRPAVDGSRQMQRDAIAASVRRAVKGTQTVEQGLEQLGEAVVGEVQKAITEVTSPPLSPITLLLRQHRKNGGTVTGRTVGNASRAALFLPSDGAAASLGVSEKPLVDEYGFLLQEVTHVVENR